MGRFQDWGGNMRRAGVGKGWDGDMRQGWGGKVETC